MIVVVVLVIVVVVFRHVFLETNKVFLKTPVLRCGYTPDSTQTVVLKLLHLFHVHVHVMLTLQLQNITQF